MNTPLTCTEPLIWACQACGHSFHAEEWQEQGRVCPACSAPRGNWHCGKCHAVFSQPFLGTEHPCLAQATSGQTVRLVSKSHGVSPRRPKTKASTPPLLEKVPANKPQSSRSIYGWPALFILLVGVGAGLLFSGKLARKDAEPLSAKDSSSPSRTSLNPEGSEGGSLAPKSRVPNNVENDPYTIKNQQASKIKATDPDAAPAASRLPPTPALKPKPAPSPALPKPQEQYLIKPEVKQESVAEPVAGSSDSSSDLPLPPDVYRDHHETTSQIPTNQNASFAPEDTPLGRFQRKLYLAIGSRWNQKVQMTMSQVGVDRIVIRFKVNTDGSISELDTVQGNPNSVLGVISADSVLQSSGSIGPFPAELLRDKPDGFPWQLAFRIY